MLKKLSFNFFQGADIRAISLSNFSNTKCVYMIKFPVDAYSFDRFGTKIEYKNINMGFIMMNFGLILIYLVKNVWLWKWSIMTLSNLPTGLTTNQ